MRKTSWVFTLLLPATSLSAQATVAFSSLGAKVVALRFFPGDGSIVPYDERFYMTEFDSATVKFITMELEIEYPKQANTVSFKLPCQYVGPVDISKPTIDATIQAGWSGSTHAGGWGAKARGSWAVGTYQVTCSEGDRVVASGSFKVTRGVWQIPSIKGVVTGLRFYEGTTAGVVVADRKYFKTFKSGSTRRVYLELGLDYPTAASASSFTVDCSYDFPDGRSFPVQIKGSVSAGWTGSYHVVNLGWDAPGNWKVGAYEVGCRFEGRLIAKGGFTIEQ